MLTGPTDLASLVHRVPQAEAQCAPPTPHPPSTHCAVQAGFNFPEAGNEHDVELRRVLAGLPDLQAAAR